MTFVHKKHICVSLMCVKARTSDDNSQCTCIWETGMWRIIFSTQCAWVCSCSCYLQSLALFMPLLRVLFRALVLKQSPTTDCQIPGWAVCRCCFSLPLTSLPCLWRHTSVCLGKSFVPKLFSVVILQLVMRCLPGLLAIICCLHLSSQLQWSNSILFNIIYGITLSSLQIVLYTVQSIFKHIIILAGFSQICNVIREW